MLPLPNTPGMLIAVLAFGALAACSGSSSTNFLTPVYDACFSVDDCVEAATTCEELAVDFAGYTYSNSICTLGCEAEGPVSADCPRAWVGISGSCYPSSIAGGLGNARICFDPCYVDEDCQLGFRCLGALSLCGNDLACPVSDDDAICVPGPE